MAGGINQLMHTGKSAMTATRSAIATTGHNISNANTEGFSRQRVQQTATIPTQMVADRRVVGKGTEISRIERLNDEYLEKQIRHGNKDLSHFEEKDLVLRQSEDIFNEMNGDGLNRLISRFYNEFRKLANEPDNEAIRQSVRESTQAMVNDFKRLRNEVDQVRQHIDSRVDGYVGEVNSLTTEMVDLNKRIRALTIAGGSPNDLLDRRDLVLKKINSFFDIATKKNNEGDYDIDLKTGGPLVTGAQTQKLTAVRSPRDEEGKPDGALDVLCESTPGSKLTHRLTGGKLGALLEVRDRTLSSVLDRLDDMAFTVSNAVNAIHRQGFTRDGLQGVNFFKELGTKDRAAEFLSLSDEVNSSVDHIATAAIADAPSDNRIALAISGLQSMKIMHDGKTSMDDFYNSIVSDIGVVNSKNRNALNQQKDIMTQLGKMRDQISGVSVDEETTNLLQFQHIFDASAKMISVADEMMQTILSLKR